jgi:hypothetical protein
MTRSCSPGGAAASPTSIASPEFTPNSSAGSPARIATPDGRRYAVGDHVVTLAPNRDGQLVTGQRGRVIAIDQRAQT